ncbi:lipoprotein localization protein LolB [Morganella morganii]|uniref:lipoprotein insertase outer membrane protein LolB n=1 Tax=Morganella morganii TaxID=582 RepID=UPI0003A63D3F|nr:lipoprotein localization protein LolB [Morganella morganii]MBS5194030.1 lipoprotein insertase outer membrane protein LolB [Morganella morganii]MBT0383126.1 lipoprotein localization protein LolB [Morganella morganii subsp. morganii]HDU8584159.1 lipoprotein localization protein LolB [Morganella morganii]
MASIQLPRFIRLLPLCSLILAACTLPDNTEKGDVSATSAGWKAQTEQINQLQRYQTRGSFAYIGTTQKTYARFFWQQYSPDNYKLLLTNPVGSTELELIVKDGQTQLTDNKGQKYYSDDPDSMIYQLTGMTIPMENLRQWIVGLPGDAQSYAISNQYHLKALSWAQGMEKWNVTYQSYDEKVSPQLPNRLDIEQGDNRIKLKMDSWTLN